MGIRKYDNLKNKLFLGLTVLILFILALHSIAGVEREDDSQIADLVLDLKSCSDPALSNRLEYRIGVLHFKKNRFLLARQCFEPLASQDQASLLIRVASQQMLAQSFRLEGKDRLALDSFSQLIDLLEKELGSGSSAVPFSQLRVSALLARAEIFQSQQNLEQSEREYQKLIAVLSQPSVHSSGSLSFAQVMDRCARVNFRLGRLNRSLELTEQAVRQFPNYTRVPMMRLEIECIRFCRTNGLTINFSEGSATLAVQVIGAIKETSHTIDPTSLLKTIEALTSEYGQNPCSAELMYHHGWLLDTLGRSDEAAKVFSHLGARKGKKSDLLLAYGKIQQAIILSEQARYAQAIKLLKTQPDFPDQSHLASMVDEVEKSIRILKR